MQKDSRTPTSVQLIIHFAMGSVLGAMLALAMLLTDKSLLPLTDMAFFVGVLSFAIGMGASMTGFGFTAIELEAKRQAQRVNQRRNPDRVDH
jgi:uncharacterized membrane protein YccC